MDDIQQYAHTHQDDFVQELRTMVEIETPTLEPVRVNELGAYVQARLRDLGAAVEVDGQSERGDHVIGRFPGASSGKPILMIGHMDTVLPAGTLAHRPFRIEDGRAFGPGTADMKSGLVIMLGVLEALRATGKQPARPLTLLFNSDEEMQSRHSRVLIEREAQKSAYALVFEGTSDVREYTSSRKASGRFTLHATGRASHAGSGLADGVNAIEELAHQVLRVQGMSDWTLGTTLSVGTIRGGERPNVVPASAEAEVSVRAVTRAEMERIDGALQALRPVVTGASLQVSGAFHRAPFEASAVTEDLANGLRRAGDAVGLELVGRPGGGASDANLTAGVGTPSVDGLGAVGFGAHSVDECVVLASIPQRVALATQLVLAL